MQAIVQGRFLKSEQRNFTNDHGEVVNFYRVQFLDDDCEPMELTCTEEVYQSREILDKLAPVSILLNIGIRQGKPNVRVIGIQAL